MSGVAQEGDALRGGGAVPPPEVSVVLGTRDRAETLARCLERYEGIRTAARWELVVVDNGSADGTRAVLERFAARGAIPLVALSEPRPGLSRARNAGLRRASGAILVVSDDDCYPDPGFVDAWRAVFADPAIDYGGGRIALFDPADAAVTLRTETEPRLLPPRRLVAPGTLHGASLAFRRGVVERIGLFDPALGPGTPIMGAEDSEYVQRASERGFTGRYSPEPLVWHHHGRKPADVPALFRGYYRGWGAFYACLLGRSPGLVWRAVREDFSARPGGLGYLRLLYWRLLAWPPRRAWHVGRGALDYARLGRGGAERRGEGAEAARRAAGGKDERPFPAP